MGLLTSIFGIDSGSKKLTEFLNKGAVIIDVRTPEEFNQEKLPNSINIPLQEFEGNLDNILKIKSPIILCCRGGVRSKKAHSILKEKRKDSINGGSWKSISFLLKKMNVK